MAGKAHRIFAARTERSMDPQRRLFDQGHRLAPADGVRNQVKVRLPPSKLYCFVRQLEPAGRKETAEEFVAGPRHLPAAGRGKDLVDRGQGGVTSIGHG